MALATWKDLCIDVVDAELMASFWAPLLGLEADPAQPGRPLHLSGPTTEHGVWLNPVAEPVSVKQRVHIDVHAAAVADVLARGATPDDVDSFRWKVLRDPEGGELCVFEREVVPAYRLYELGVDCARPLEVARWWAEVFGVEVEQDAEDAWVAGVPGMPFESIVFNAVPEAKTVKNRIHWDVDTDSVEALVDHGATVLRTPDADISWTILADPEGNEFCTFLP